MEIARRPLGRSGITVPILCLGSMTWGSQCDEQQAHAQLDRARAEGIDFVDTAEMYAVPPRAQTYGATEEIIGRWLARHGGRDRLILATKIAGPSEHFSYIRGGRTRFNRSHLEAALEQSLRRLATDYVDLYQLHWPDRPIRAFGTLGYAPYEGEETAIAETLEACDRLIQTGKVRMIGLSNETAWGTMRFLRRAKEGFGPRIVSVQNPYSLLNRSFETGLAEVAIRESCGLLAYAPLAAGVLSGKYLAGAQPRGARFDEDNPRDRYSARRADAPTAAYVELARTLGLDPSALALAFVLTRPFLTSAIFGVTSDRQFDKVFDALKVDLSPEILEKIEEIHRRYTYPCP